MKRQAGILALVLAVGAVACGDDDEPAQTGGAEPEKITGVGGVKLGKTYAQLRQQGLVKKIGRGCELGSGDTRFAALEAPLKGGVNFTPTSPRKVTYITISGGAKARGVGVGASISEIKAAFPQAKVGGESVAGYTLVDIPKNSGGPLTFAVKPDTKKTIAIGIPGMAFCE
jgi:hypothetical protein